MANPAFDPSDPLAGWQPGSGSPVATQAVSPDDPLQAAPRKSVLDTPYHTLPSDTRQGQAADNTDEAARARVRAATREGWDSSSFITPEYQAKMNAAPEPFGWINRNIVNPVINAPFQAAGALGGAVGSTLGEVFDTPGLRANIPGNQTGTLGRDVNALLQTAPVAVGMETATRPPRLTADQTAAVRELSQPPTPTPIELAQAQDAARKSALRANAQPDATTDATISLLRRTNPNAAATVPVGGVTLPTPPQPFTPGLLGAQPPASTPPGSGLLAVPARPGPTPAAAATMTADEIRARAEGYYSPADKAAAQGAMLPQDNANAVRSSVTDIMPSDPEKAKYFASTNPTVAAAAKDVSQFSGNPMSYDSAMQLDRRLTSDIRATKDPNEQRLLGQMQDGVRTQMDQVPDLANQSQARQAYTQYIKQSQMEDINYNASLKNDPAQQAASVRQQAALMLKNDSKMRNWNDEERAQLEQVAKSGDIGMLGRLSVGLVRPVARALGGAAGGWITGSPVGGIVGAEIGGDIGATQAAKLRAYLSQTTLDPVMAQISRGVPPIPTPPRARPPGG